MDAEGVERIVNRILSASGFGKMATGQIIAITNLGCTVIINGITYTNIRHLDSYTPSLNDTVAIIIPNGQSSNQYILGKLSY